MQPQRTPPMAERRPLWLHLGTLLLLLFGLGGCGGQTPRTFYTLTYPAQPALSARPLDLTVRLKDFTVRDTYKSAELVFRPDVHEIRFYRTQRWSERPEKMVTALVRDHLRASGIVARVVDSASASLPDFTLTGEVEALEQLDDEGRRFARLALTYRLIRYHDNQQVWTWRFDERRPVSDGEVRSTVRTLSQILSNKTQEALNDLYRRFEAGGATVLDGQAPSTVAPVEQGARPLDPANERPTPPAEGAGGLDDPKAHRVVGAPGSRPAWYTVSSFGELPGTAPLASQVSPPQTPVKPGVLGPMEGEDHPQLQADGTAVPMGRGAIFVPSLSNGIREPIVLVLDGKQQTVAEGRSGERLVVSPGEYTVRFGSGAPSQQFSYRVQVEAGRVTLVPAAEWAALDVQVLDPQFVPFRGSYEIIRVDDREDFGVGFGADGLLGEQTRVWVLKPGLYKIIRSGGTYRDRTDFATVRLEAGELTSFALVLDQLTGDLRGAGELTGTVIGGEAGMSDSHWTLRAVVGGNFGFNRDEQTSERVRQNVNIDIFLDATTIYNDKVHLWSTRVDIESGLVRAADTEEFRSLNDRFFVNSIYVYQFTERFGPYARVGLETKLLARYEEFSSPRVVLDETRKGSPLVSRNRARLGGPFQPLTLFQGAGGNLRLVRSRPLELDVRLGMGGRQTLSNGFRNYFAMSGTQEDPDLLREAPTNEVFGFEGTLVGVGRFWRFIGTTEFDGLVPVTDDQMIFSWRNQIGFRLASFASINYRYNLIRDANLGLGDDLKGEHDVQLRFSYNLF